MCGIADFIQASFLDQADFKKITDSISHRGPDGESLYNNTICIGYEQLLPTDHNFPRVVMKEIIVAAWRYGGIGTNRALKILAEYYHIKLENKVAAKFCLWLIYQWSLAKHYIKLGAYKMGLVECM